MWNQRLPNPQQLHIPVFRLSLPPPRFILLLLWHCLLYLEEAYSLLYFPSLIDKCPVNGPELLEWKRPLPLNYSCFITFRNRSLILQKRAWGWEGDSLSWSQTWKCTFLIFHGTHQMCCRQGFHVNTKKAEMKGREGLCVFVCVPVPLCVCTHTYTHSTLRINRPLHLDPCNFNDPSFMNIIEHISAQHAGFFDPRSPHAKCNTQQISLSPGEKISQMSGLSLVLSGWE